MPPRSRVGEVAAVAEVVEMGLVVVEEEEDQTTHATPAAPHWTCGLHGSSVRAVTSVPRPMRAPTSAVQFMRRARWGECVGGPCVQGKEVLGMERGGGGWGTLAPARGGISGALGVVGEVWVVGCGKCQPPCVSRCSRRRRRRRRGWVGRWMSVRARACGVPWLTVCGGRWASAGTVPSRRSGLGPCRTVRVQCYSTIWEIPHCRVPRSRFTPSISAAGTGTSDSPVGPVQRYIYMKLDIGQQLLGITIFSLQLL
ncbi:hypothetical protein CALVIDRAFT_68570 [Calocera viscosa TUFC12733]|uniref:Uncharacterized protein n=1 Tax=Calocera viscosa (strain TUFC12733) TaxID=1330018 RepID=A0A167N9B7_CALVF|nr:hypothetical protein CALVIDRAFT_68570 [Calocera viscosa TUFC12733]